MIQFLFIGTTGLLLISGIALLLFGGKKLPEMMRGLGQGVKQFKEGMKDINPMEEAEEPDKKGVQEGAGMQTEAKPKKEVLDDENTQAGERK